MKLKILNPDFLRAISEKKQIKLHLGSGESHLEGYFSVDLVELPGTDIVADLNKPLDSIPDNSIDAIFTRHTLEHIDNFMGLMAELHRICRPDAVITIIVPHFSNPYFYSDPTHVRPFGLYTMHYFMEETEQPRRKVPTFYCDTRFSLVNTRIDFYRTSLFDRLLVPFIRTAVNFSFTTQAIYERRWVWLFPAWQIHYVLRPVK